MKRPLFAGLLCLLVSHAYGQHLIQGRVTARENGEPLPAATIQVEGTYSGTITNADGDFAIEVGSLPAVLVVRFLGYATERVPLDAAPRASLAVRLTAQPFELPGVVVSSEDPAVEIMRRVIRRKRTMRDSLRTFQADAYNRFTLENDTGIVSIIEGLSRFVWDRERGSREVVRAQRSTDNLNIDGLVPAGLFVANLYDDDIDVSGHKLVGVTHPDAIKYYDFRLVNTTRQDGRDVFTISVRTRSKLTSGFQGTVVVADSVFALQGVDLRPNESFVFPAPIQFFDVLYRQQFLPFGQDQWLPVDFRAELDLKVGFRGLLSFPVFRIRQFSRLTDYRVNVPLADSLYASRRQVYRDSTVLESAALLDQEGSVVPLDARERLAYAQIDSSLSMEEAFEPDGAMARMAKMSMRFGNEEIAAGSGGGRLGLGLGFEPSLTYNRVEGVSPALTISLGRRFRTTGRIGYAFGLNEVFQGYSASYAPLASGRWTVGWDRRIRSTYSSWRRWPLENSISFLLGRPDYFDYFRSTRVSASFQPGRRRGFPALRVGLQREDAEAVPLTTDFQLRDLDPVAPNPIVPDSRVTSVVAEVQFGEPPDPFGIVASNSLTLDLEAAPKPVFDNRSPFVRGQVRATVHIPTFYRRRLLSQSLDVHMAVGLSSGQLPVHRMWAIDGGNRGSKPGTLRTLAGRPYQGDRTALLTWEHHFRTVPFERLGFRWAADRGWGVIVFGGHGRSWLRRENRTSAPHVPVAWDPQVSRGWHHEVGLSLSGLVGVLRLDVARKLDRGEWALGIGAARLFCGDSAQPAPTSTGFSGSVTHSLHEPG